MMYLWCGGMQSRTVWRVWYHW